MITMSPGMTLDGMTLTPWSPPAKTDVGSITLGSNSGTAPYYYTNAHNDLKLDSDFTIEFFLRKDGAWNSGAGGIDYPLQSYDAFGTSQWWGLDLGRSGFLAGVYFSSQVAYTSGNFLSYGATLGYGTSLNNVTWYHIALTRVLSTGAMVLYIDGVARGTATVSAGSSLSSSTQWKIDNTVYGRMTYIRYTRKVVYTATFTKPATVLLPLPETALMIYPITADNAVIDYSKNNIGINLVDGSVRHFSISTTTSPF